MLQQVTLERVTQVLQETDLKTVFKLVGKRPRRLFAHFATFFVLFYLLLTLARRSDASVRSTTSLKRRSPAADATLKEEFQVDADVRLELERLFKKADTTADGKLSKKELAWSISK